MIHPGLAGAREQSRARYPDVEGYVERDGVRIFYEVYGDGDPTILLLPTWSIIHSRHWKAQIPYLARHFRVVTFDGRGNGKSDRPEGVAAYLEHEFVADALAVMDATGTRTAVLAGLSCAANWMTPLAADHPERVLAAIFIGPAVPLAPGHPERAITARFEEELDTDEGWAKYNRHYWQRDYLGLPRVLLRADVPRAALDQADRGLHRLGARDRPGDARRHDVGDGPLRARGVQGHRGARARARCWSSTAIRT